MVSTHLKNICPSRMGLDSLGSQNMVFFFKFLDRNAGAFFGVTSRPTVRGCLAGSDSNYYSLSVSL